MKAKTIVATGATSGIGEAAVLALAANRLRRARRSSRASEMRKLDRLQRLIDDARAKGARIAEVGKRPETAQCRPHTLAPLLVLGATDDMVICRKRSSPGPAGRHLCHDRRCHRLCERASAPVGALLFRRRRCRPPQGAVAHDIG
jgi:NAD(P)-dependent dehydrogenase (short-subunit alcohol dehydrogenase family)